MFTEELCTPGNQQTGSCVWLLGGGRKRDTVDKATGAHYPTVYAGPRHTVDGCQSRVWIRQMGLWPEFHIKDI